MECDGSVDRGVLRDRVNGFAIVVCLRKAIRVNNVLSGVLMGADFVVGICEACGDDDDPANDNDEQDLCDLLDDCHDDSFL